MTQTFFVLMSVTAPIELRILGSAVSASRPRKSKAVQTVNSTIMIREFKKKKLDQVKQHFILLSEA
jgi:hypothetical protein